MRVTNFTLPLRLGAAGLILSCAATLVHAEMYKWVDESGAVTYTNVPPPQAKSRGKLELIVPGSAAVSTYSSIESLGNAGFTSYERALKERVAQLELALEAERHAKSQVSESQASRAAQRRKDLRERCLADRRVDCDRADLEESPVHIAVVRAPQVIRQVIVQPEVIRAIAPQRAPHQPHPERRHSDTTQHPPSQLTVTFGMPSKPATTGQRWRY